MIWNIRGILIFRRGRILWFCWTLLFSFLALQFHNLLLQFFNSPSIAFLILLLFLDKSKDFLRLFFQNLKSLLHFRLFVHISHDGLRKLIILIYLLLIIIIQLCYHIFIFFYLLLRYLQLLIVLFDRYIFLRWPCLSDANNFIFKNQ